MTPPESHSTEVSAEPKHGIKWFRQQGKQLHTKTLGTRRRKAITLGSTLLIVAIVGASITAGIVSQQVHDAAVADAAIAAAHAADIAKQAADAKAKVDAANALIALKATAAKASKDALHTETADAAWADPTLLANVEAIRLQLVTAAEGSDTVKILGLYNGLKTAQGLVGTQADSEDRAYIAALKAAGKASNGTISNADQAATGRSFCSGLDKDFKTPDLAAAKFNVDTYYPNLQAIAIYCPKYQPVIDARVSPVGNGTFSVGDSASAFGVYPRVLEAGTYAQGPVTDCYWERSSGAGKILANDFITNSPAGFTVTIHSGEGFTSTGCREWTKQ